MKYRRTGKEQGGVVLLIALLVLLVLGVVAAAVARTSRLQLHMAGNDETRIAALQQALAMADAVLSQAVAAPLPGGVGYRRCMADSPDQSCDERTVTAYPAATPARGSTDVSVLRAGPATRRLPVMGETRASSTVHYRVATIEVRVTYDGWSQNRGGAAIAQGVFVRLPASHQLGREGE